MSEHKWNQSFEDYSDHLAFWSFNDDYYRLCFEDSSETTSETVMRRTQIKEIRCIETMAPSENRNQVMKDINLSVLKV